MVVYLLVVFVSLGAVPPAEGLPTWQLLDRYGEIGIVRAAQAFMPRFGVVLVLLRSERKQDALELCASYEKVEALKEEAAACFVNPLTALGTAATVQLLGRNIG